MCGIVGLYTTNQFVTESVAKRMLDSVSHRGRDDYGLELINTNYKQKNTSQPNFFIGHRRLSILDLSSLGHQPMSTDDNAVWLSYNGEIYNFKEIRRDLINRGYKFKSNTDTEVVLYSYLEFGIKCVERFKGFFAFCIYDYPQQRFFLARDRLGAKPLKYFFDGKTFAFSSEIKAFLEVPNIKRELDFQSISDFLSHGYIPSSRSIFSKISKLPAGHFIDFDIKKSKLTTKKYWEPSFLPKIDIPYNDAKERTREILRKAVDQRTISDVPIGVYLSGGIDSSLIVSLLSESIKDINTFSIGFKESAFDERRYAREVSQKYRTNHHEFLVESNLDEDLENIVASYDEPFADPSIIPSYYLSKEVSSHVKVVLGGDGADEILAGYKRYNIHRRNYFLNYFPNLFNDFNKQLLMHMPVAFNKRSFNGKFARILEALAFNYCDSYYLRFSGFSLHHKYHMFGQDKGQFSNSIWGERVGNFLKANNGLDSLDQLLAIDQLSHLPEYILNKSDISGMANGLEIRAPFIDTELNNWVNRLDSSFKNKGYSKRIFKDILSDQGVSKEIIHRKKAGFTPPLRSWMKNSHELIRYFCLSSDSPLRFFDANFLRKFYKYNLNNDFILSNQVFKILVLGVWIEKFDK